MDFLSVNPYVDGDVLYVEIHPAPDGWAKARVKNIVERAAAPVLHDLRAVKHAVLRDLYLAMDMGALLLGPVGWVVGPRDTIQYTQVRDAVPSINLRRAR